ncbi:hypothetical protein [Pseudoruegeria aquimaris]|uniref:hypothetical protein n=1 Tax=Pseudoruegeria aquimaris TaxID=393663 RepID=UPI00111C7E53|nr:hypothetical protein [Pseudoruegeria aquimaris]
MAMKVRQASSDDMKHRVKSVGVEVSKHRSVMQIRSNEQVADRLCLFCHVLGFESPPKKNFFCFEKMNPFHSCSDKGLRPVAAPGDQPGTEINTLSQK